MNYNIKTSFNESTCIIGNAMSGKTTLGKYLSEKLDKALFVENKIVNNSFEYLVELFNLEYQYYIIDDIFTYLNIKERLAIINMAKDKNKIIIDLTTDSKDTLLFPYLMVINNYEIIMEGNNKDILKEEKIFSNIGIKLPFIVQLSKELKDYNVISDYAYSSEELINLLWK